MKKGILTFLLIFIFINLRGEDLLSPLPLKMEVNKDKVVLGKKLFLDTKLSHDNTLSCASCHPLFSYGVDNLKFSFGIKKQEGNINTPTVYNSTFNFAQFWDGRAKNLKEQVKGPIINPIEMGSDFDEIISKLSKDKEYKNEFEKIYKDGITTENIIDSIAEFERSLITPNSKFDKYLRDEANLTKDELAGFELFQSKGCIACHNGINIGGNLFQKIGIFAKFEDNGEHLGRYNVTKKEEDKYFFKVPSLRNVAKTAPYFHNGSIQTLSEAVEKMAYYQLGRKLKKKEVNSIVKFLHTLTGEINEK